MRNSERFVQAYNRIEQCLRSLRGGQRDSGFRQLVDQTARHSALVRRYRRQLKEFAELRNAIVHDTVDSYVIAEPNDRAVRDIELIADRLTQPPQVDSLFAREVTTFTPDTSLADALQTLAANNFSQAPIYEHGRCLGLLSATSIAEWLSQQPPQRPVLLNKLTLRDLLKTITRQEDWATVERTASIADVLELFRRFEQRGLHLKVVLLTESGSADQRPLGVITMSDLPSIYAILDGEE